MSDERPPAAHENWNWVLLANFGIALILVPPLLSANSQREIAILFGLNFLNALVGAFATLQRMEGDQD